jgi:hypothetical protein
VLDGRFAKKAKRGRHDFAFSGLITCVQCGCAVVGEIKKQRYVYYHCTGYTDKCQGNPASCRRKYVREEALERQFTELLGRLKFDDEVLEWVCDALHASHADERREHEDAIKRHQAEYKRLQDRLNVSIWSNARMTIATENLPGEIEALKQIVADLARDAVVAQAEIAKLKLQLARYRRAEFGRSSEKLARDLAQLELAIEAVETDQVERLVASPPAVAAVIEAAVEAQKPARRPLPEHLPREEVVHPAPCTCPSCGGALRRSART